MQFPLSHSLVGNREVSGKSERIAALPADLTPDEAAAFDERAAFLEYDCGLSRADAERQARAELRLGTAAPTPPTATRLPERDGLGLWRAALERLSPHEAPCPGYRVEEWPRTLSRALAFIETFGKQAEALGWTAPRLFGVHPQVGIVRVDCCGALVLPIGGAVRAITADEISFGHLTHRAKSGQAEGVPIWSFGR